MKAGRQAGRKEAKEGSEGRREGGREGRQADRKEIRSFKISSWLSKSSSWFSSNLKDQELPFQIFSSWSDLP